MLFLTVIVLARQRASDSGRVAPGGVVVISLITPSTSIPSSLAMLPTLGAVCKDLTASIRVVLATAATARSKRAAARADAERPHHELGRAMSAGYSHAISLHRLSKAFLPFPTLVNPLGAVCMGT